MKEQYTVFSKYVYRSPLFNFHKYSDNSIYFEAIFNESLFLASPEFYKEKSKMSQDDQMPDKMKQSLTKYLSRSSTRCTPFGLFAGCSVGTIGDKTNIILDDPINYQRVTRLDMNYMCALIQDIEKRKEIREQLKFYTNDSIYKLGGSHRHIEYYYAGTRRVHKISSVEESDYLSLILEEAKHGKYCNELANLLVDDEITYEEASEFIEELIESQILKSELEINVTGDNSLDVLIKKLNKLKDTNNLTNTLCSVNDLLKKVDHTSLGNSLKLYDEIIEKISSLNVKFEPKFLFQTDMFKPSINSIISSKITDDIYSLIVFLNKITPKQPQTNLSLFRKAFYERYEENEIPLLEVMDTELGIGYLQNGGSDTPNELIANIAYKMQGAEGQISSNASKLQSILLNKYVECIRNNSNVITLTDEDVSRYEADWKDLPNTLSVLCSLLKKNDGESQIYIKSIGGSSAANLLGRFCHLDKEIEMLSKEITKTDQQLTDDAILAEIVHLPESRIGNILFRPVLRDYEIHYLANSELSSEHSIPLSDLYLSIKGNKIFMRSKRLNKEIIPRLTTAHNYSYNALPVYQFLCEMQTQNLRGGLYFGWDTVFNSFEYKPRVMYGNFILSREQWFIDGDKIKNLTETSVKEYLISHHIPQYVIIADSDNEQFVDFENRELLALFINIIKKRKKLWVEEFLFDPNDGIIKDSQGNFFCNEFLFSYYKKL